MGGQQNPSRLGLKTTSGEIVEVQGGHILRSTGRKDRHSKVCTAKGPRDRRVRLAAHTAIQFYDVQDRLGYDRPSKAVDWLIKKAKAAIDELAELPAWKPTMPENVEEDLYKVSGAAIDEEEQGLQTNNNNNNQQSHYLPPDCDARSFFPMGSSSSSMEFHGSHSQDLKLSLQSFQDPIMQEHPPAGQFLLSGFDGTTAWPDHHGGGYLFNLPPPAPLPLQLLGHNQFVSQRGPLQSSNLPSIRAWVDSPTVAISGHPPPPPDYHPEVFPIYPSSVFASGFSGFRIPARIQGDDEEHDGYSDKPSSASSDSRH